MTRSDPVRLPHGDPPGFRGELHRDDRLRDERSGASGILHARPAGVAIPRDGRDVAALVRWAAEHGVPLVPRGAGTGMPGGNVGPGVVVDLVQGFRDPVRVDPSRRRAWVAPGITLAELNMATAPFGLHLPVDPSSGARCTVGGMIANNSAGAHSVKHGAMRAWVERLDLVLADGTQASSSRGETPSSTALQRIAASLRTVLEPAAAEIEAGWPRVRKNASGYAILDFLRSGDLLDLVIGSEGTLGLVTAAELRLCPLPAARGLALLEFTSLEAAGAAVMEVLRLEPSTCEMLDRTFLDLVRAGGGDAAYPLRPGLEAILLVEVEGESDAEVEAGLDEISRALSPHADAVRLASAAKAQHDLWSVRHAASPLIAAASGRRVSMQFIEDGVVPVQRLPEYVALLREILGRAGIPAVIFGHAGDGNLHVNPLVDVSRPGWREEIEAIVIEVAEGVARLGGTMSGEHGDGRLRAPLIHRIWGREMVERFRRVKTAFDPAGILNPGVILPLPGQRPLDAIREFTGPV